MTGKFSKRPPADDDDDQQPARARPDDLPAVVAKINQLCDAMRAAGLTVEVTAEVGVNFVVHLGDPNPRGKPLPQK